MSDAADVSGLDGHGGEEAQAVDAVRAVVAWYNARILDARRASVPDEERVEALKAGRQAALEDHQRLDTADPQETERIAALYAARLKELKES
ncbi:hypothetical protein ACFWIB_30805 [Streptomyces sp. NPDC127051]|uniref:hypothetical protein n=1 Tax=Streptomyces sp. NPDC127051 TaxID=3347119 RepID=UPI00364FACCD